MKKKSIMLGSVVILAVLLVVGGTMAWFTDSKEVANVFKAGTVNIQILENDEPVKGLTFPNINPGDTPSKKVEVKSLGSEPTYIRVKLDPTWILITPPQGFNSKALNVAEITFGDKWIYRQDGYYYYTEIVLNNGITQPLFNSVTFNGENMGNAYQGANFTLEVVAEAIQAKNEAALNQWGVDPLTLAP